jgi:hypothetical protein
MRKCLLLSPLSVDVIVVFSGRLSVTAGYSEEVGTGMYPLFFYQFPESIPNLAIALGISPPDGILRKMLRVLMCRASTLGKRFQQRSTDSLASSNASISPLTETLVASSTPSEQLSHPSTPNPDNKS